MAANPASQPQQEQIQSSQINGTAEGRCDSPDRAQTETALEQAIRILFRPGDLVEVRGKLLTGTCRSKFYSDHKRLARVIEKANASGKYEAIWCTLQRLKPSALDCKQRDESTGREDIQSYEWLPIDVDRPAGDPNKKFNATDQELATLKQVASDIVRWLKQQGFPSPIFACSGNGWHLLYKLPSLAPTWYADLKDVLKAVANQFEGVSGKFADGKICQIDTSLAEPEQVCKIYGTMSRKSPTNEQPRPWRESYIEYVPHKIVPVTESTLGVVASLAPPAPKKLKRSEDGVLTAEIQEDPYRFFDWAEPFIHITAEYMDADVRCFVSDTCCLDLADPLHHHKNRTVYRLGETFGIRCFADQCEGKTIADVLHNLALLKSERYPGRIWLDDPLAGFDAEYIAPDADYEDIVPEASVVPTTDPVAQVSAAAPVPEPDTESLDFPEDCMYGILGEQAKMLDLPLGYAFPAMLAAYSVEPDFDEMCDDTRINIYLAIAGSIGSGKNEAMKRAIKVRALTKGVDYKRSELASNRGLMNLIGEKISHKKGGKEVEKTPGPKKFLLQTNEIVAIFKKASIDNSTLFEMLCDLWDENDYSVPDRKGTQDCDCRLSWVGGLPISVPEDFAKVFGKQTSFGLMSRFIFAYSTKPWRHKSWKCPAASQTVPIDADSMEFPAAEGRVECFSPEAEAMMEAWWDTAHAADASNRLQYNLKKVAILTASANRDKLVTGECMAKAIKFMNWQIALRSLFKPSEATTDAAAFGEKVLNYFEKYTRKQILAGKAASDGTVHLDWKRIGHDMKWGKQDGAWMLFSTIQNLLRVGELIAIKETDEEGKSNIDPKFNLLPRLVRLPRKRQ